MKLDRYLFKKGYCSIPLEYNKVGNLQIEIMLGKKKAYALVDTGATGSVLDRGYARKHRYRLRKLKGKGGGVGNNKMELYRARIDHLCIHDFELTDLPVIAIDLSHVNEALENKGNHPVAFVIGADLLREYHGIIDYQYTTLYLLPPGSSD
jgi:predicted aspartyl protease